MNCPQCGTKNRDRARFCVACGTRLEQDTPETESPELTVSAQTPDTGDEPVAEPPTSITPAETGEATIASSPPAAESETTDRPAQQPPKPDDTPTIPSNKTTVPLASLQPAGESDLEAEAPDSSTPAETAGPAPTSPEPAVETTEIGPGKSAESDTESVSSEAALSDMAQPLEPTAAGVLPPEVISPVSQPASGELPQGTVLQNRFEILGVLGRERDETLYQARDQARCWQCGATNTPPGDEFCIECGAKLAPDRSLCHIRETFSSPVEIPGGTLANFEENGRWYIVMPEEKTLEEEPPDTVKSGLRLTVGQATHLGQVREQDEDSVLALTCNALFEGNYAPCLGFYAVADGMGGHEAGEIASQMAVRIIAEWVIGYILLPEVKGDSCLPETAVAQLTEAVQEANGKIYLRRQQEGNEMGTTLTAALILRNMAIVVNAGDSRTYLWRSGELKQITTDHSAVARLIEVGEVQPEEMYTHPQRSTIYRSLGDKPMVEVDSFVETLVPGDRLLLCCDGVWESLRPDGLEEVMLAWPDPHHAAGEIIKRANLAGGEDNLSVVIVSVEGG